MDNGIIWLASYPKSGNTWLRIFLHNYLLDPSEPSDINYLPGIPIASARALFDELVGIESTDLTPDEIDALRPQFYRAYITADIAPQLNQMKFLKIHDAYTYLPDGRALFPAEATRGILYCVRNPLDVAISYANFEQQSIDEIIERMNDPGFQAPTEPYKYLPQLRQQFLSWNDHVNSWSLVSGIPRLLIRYEDMLESPIETFGTVIRFLGLPVEADRLEKAIRFSSFKGLKEQEKKRGFIEHKFHRSEAAFFNRGQAGAWREKLTPEQVRSLVDHHGEIMRTLRYWDGD